MIDQTLTSFWFAVGFEPYTWLLLFVALTALDGFLTAHALRKGASEANVIMKWVMSKIGTVPALFLTKAVGISAIFGILQEVILYMPLLVLLYAGVCAWNVRVILR